MTLAGFPKDKVSTAIFEFFFLLQDEILERHNRLHGN